ncbi:MULTISPECIES: sodium/phosphate symporter [Natrialbaceae]|uniref:sodium/phosphate symporter n=1 Tax=Natrialbaceae TaxID=1644061 RepID=UPI00207D0BA0|nr:sodium/phosphate symporter [Natronococcus sp. CG52]
MDRRRLGKAAVIVVAVAVAVRLAPLVWTPYPFNPDGFNFAAQARNAIAAGSLPLEAIGPHGYVLPTLLSLVAVITNIGPLWLAQPIIALVGALPPVIAVVLVWRLASSRSHESAVTLAALAAGLTLALEGLYLRRTVTVSYEVLGILFVALVVIGAHQFCRTRRPAWGIATIILLVALPITHHLSTFMAALTLTGVVVLAVARDWRRALGPGLVVLVPFWLYVLGYYALTRPPFSDELASKPGLFAAWVIVMAVGAVWLARAPARPLRLAIGGTMGGGFAILGANAVWELFPATAATPPQLLMYMAPLTVLAALAIWGLPLGTGLVGDRAVVLALLAAPLAWTGFAITAGVDPVYALFARRGQTFVHLATVVCAGLAILALARRVDTPTRRKTVTVGLPLVLCLCALASLPLAFAGLEALAYQGTTTSEEFASATFATHSLEEWTSDDHITRVASNYHQAGASPQPAYGWLHGGGELRCPTVMQASWQTVGAQRYPSSPLSIDRAAYQGTIATEHAVYATGGTDPVTIVVPTTDFEC